MQLCRVQVSCLRLWRSHFTRTETALALSSEVKSCGLLSACIVCAIKRSSWHNCVFSGGAHEDRNKSRPIVITTIRPSGPAERCVTSACPCQDSCCYVTLIKLKTLSPSLEKELLSQGIDCSALTGFVSMAAHCRRP